MFEALLVGSGPAAAGAALALTKAGIRPVVVDIGRKLEAVHAGALSRIQRSAPDDWSKDDRLLISRQPVASLVDGLPEKRAYGSDFPFQDAGQLEGVVAAAGVHRAVVSSAYGGFSNVWGAQLMPFTRSTFEADWPLGLDEMAPHYQAILQEVPFSGVADDLEELFPLLRPPNPLPLVAERTAKVLEAYGRHRDSLRRRGVRVGLARLAATGHGCVKCGLCMTGCPYSLIYSASHTFDRLRANGLVSYLPDRLAVRVEGSVKSAKVSVRNLANGAIEVLEARRLFLACGALGTTRLVAPSLGLYGQEITAGESAQFTVPFVSVRPTADPRQEPRFTLNQFNMVIQAPEGPRNLSQIHFYTFNDAFLGALPAALRSRRGEKVAREVLRHLTVGIGYLPSWFSPAIRIGISRPEGRDRVAGMEVGRDELDWSRHRMLQTVKRRMLEAAPRLDLWPLFPKTIFAAGAKSYHVGATFPHSKGPHGPLSSDRLGRVGGWKNIHLIDASVFPSVPATTFTFTIMANAHRIASETIDLDRPVGPRERLVPK